MAYIEQLLATLDAQIEALNREIASLQEARAALLANASAGGPMRQTRAKSVRRGKSSPRRAVLEPEAAERILADGDGLTATELARQTGAGRDQVVKLLRDLEAARRARRTGQGRGTRWHGLTDEDWIRERAEELAARRRRS